MKKFLSILFIIVIAVGGFVYYKLDQFIHQPVNVRPDQLITLERGTTGKKLADLLEKENIVSDATLLPWVLKLQPQFNNVKAGTYSLNNIHTMRDLLNLLVSGKEVQLSLRFTEGTTFKDWQKLLKTAPHLEQTLQHKTESEIFSLLDLPDIKPLQEQRKIEGWLYPDTYNYVPGSKDIELLKRAADHMKKVVAKAWAERDADLPLADEYEMLILASIVEKESGLAAERAKIASVFINRLKYKMKLQTDPTVIYGMDDEYTGNIRKKDLEQPTAYNTYVIDGLPPTPIAMPSESAIMAVAHPERTDFLYFVADGTGGHKFSRSLNEHNRAVQDYLRWLRNNKQQVKVAVELKTADSKSTGQKTAESKTAELKTTEPKPTESKTLEPKSAEQKTAE